MALEVGSVFARLGARLDDSGFARWESHYRRAKEQAAHPIEARGGMRYDARGHDQYLKGTRAATHETGNLEKAMAGGEGRIGKYAIGMRSAGAALLGGAGAFGLVEGMKAAVDRAGELEKTQKQTEAAIRSTGGAANVSAGHVEELSKRLGNMAGQDHELVQAGANILLTFRDIRNEAGKNNDIFDQGVRSSQNLATAMHMDVTQAALQVGKALNDPEKGMTRLQRIGVTFTKQQIAQAKAMEESGNRIGAQKVILNELNKEFGGSAHAAGTTMPAALNRLKVTILDAFGKLGTLAAPAISAAAKGLGNLIKAFSSGSGSAGKFAGGIKTAFGIIGSVARSVFGFVGSVIRQNAGTFQTMGNTIGKVANDVKRLLNGILGAFRSTFSSGSGTGKDLRTIIRDVLLVMAAVQKVEEAIIRRALPGIITAFRGLAQIIKGVVQVIAGILTLNFTKVWDGVKNIFGGALKVIGGLLRAATAPIREAVTRITGALSSVFSKGVDDAVGFFKRLPGRVLSAVAGLPGALAGLGKRAVGAFASALSGLPDAIGHALSAGGSFIGNIGRSIADWINAHTPFGDDIKVGPIHVHLPALAGGGKVGNVGPGHGGARVFIAGEGGADEWVISQEGNRGQNVRWAREALESLTGKRVELHRGGKGARRKKHSTKLTPVMDTSGTKRHVGGGEAGIKDYDRDIGRMERLYDLKERDYAGDDSDFVIENDDGTSSLDLGAIGNRLGDLGSLHAMRQKIADKYAEYKKAVEALVKVYNAAIDRLTKAIAAAKGSRRKTERSGYLTLRQDYTTRVAELKDLAKDLDLDIYEQSLDLKDLEKEATSLDPDHRNALLPPAPSSTDTGTGDTGTGTGDTGTGTGTGDTGTGTGTGDGSGDTGTTSSPPTPADIAAAAKAEVANFNAARADLFGNYGGNFMAAGSSGFLSEPALAAGARYFGAGGSYGGRGAGGGAGAPQVTQIITFTGPQPADPHTFAQTTMHELQAAV